MEENSRPRGTVAYKMPEEVTGPFDSYALLVRDTAEGVQCRMVHTEGVAYLVTDEKPWVWNDYDKSVRPWTVPELLACITDDNEVDLADWVRTFGARLESNFYQAWQWANA
jgi:hypothetical protein